MDLHELFKECQKRGIQQKEREFTELLEIIVDNKYKSVLEIGAYSNGCTYAFSKLCESVVTIDLEHKSKEYLPNVKYLTGNSHNEYNHEKAKGEYDVIFIDGDHTYEGAKADYELYKGYAKKGGIICFHDIWDTEDHARQNCFVSKLWNDLKQNNKFIELGKDIQTWGGIGVLYV
jgi:predicted O-methyltransferase YrrM